jgi:type VI protein secretion system component VasK
VNFLFWRVWEWFALVAGLGVTAIGAYFLGRWSWRWLLAIVVAILAVVFLIVLPWRSPATLFLDPDLPPLFLHHFWTWVLVFLLVSFGSILFLVRALRAARPAARSEEAPAVAGRFPEIESAWQEITIRLEQAQIDLAAQHVLVVLAPHEDWSASLIQSAGLQLFAQAPETAAPIHAYATAEGVLLSVAGASSFGTQDVDGIARLETVCRLLLSHRPDCPGLRGVVVLFPLSWAGQPDSIKWAAAVRDDLRTLQRVFKLRCPVFTLISEMESAPGFLEFLRRMSNSLRQSRCGFAVPTSYAYNGDLVQRGLVWMSGWFHGWALNLMADDLLNQVGNNRLFCLDLEFRRYRKRLRSLVDSALATPRESEPVAYRGCYFVATGAAAAEQAFSAGLLRGARGRLFAEHASTEWTAQAEADDRRYRRLALAVGLGGGAFTLLAWLYIIVVTGNPWWWIGPAALVVTWIVAIVRLARW